MTREKHHTPEGRGGAGEPGHAKESGERPGSSDPIGQAIDDASQVRMVDTGTIAIHVSGRPLRMQVPADLTEAEALAIVGFVVNLPDQLRKARGPGIVVPSGIVVPH